MIRVDDVHEPLHDDMPHADAARVLLEPGCALSTVGRGRIVDAQWASFAGGPSPGVAARTDALHCGALGRWALSHRYVRSGRAWHWKTCRG